jgi:hypothetical protein
MGGGQPWVPVVFTQVDLKFFPMLGLRDGCGDPRTLGKVVDYVGDDAGFS